MAQPDWHRKSELEQAIGHRLTDRMWAALEEERYLWEVDQGDMSIGELAQTVRHRLATWGGSDPVGKETDKGTLPNEGSGSAAQQDDLPPWLALSLGLVAEALKLEPVQDFRSTNLEGSLLEASEVDAWVQEKLASEGPPTTYIANIRVPDDRSLDFSALPFIVNPPVDVASTTRVEFIVLRYYQNGLQGAFRDVRVRDRGVLDTLRRLAGNLGIQFGWSMPQAVSFVLTGSIPRFEPIKAQVNQYSPFSVLTRVQLEVSPTQTPEEVASDYKKIRDRLVKKRPRALSLKHKMLAIFAATCAPDETWKQRMRDWNESLTTENKYGIRPQPKWRYNNPRNFGRDSKAAYQRLLQPDLVQIGSSSRQKEVKRGKAKSYR